MLRLHKCSFSPCIVLRCHLITLTSSKPKHALPICWKTRKTQARNHSFFVRLTLNLRPSERRQPVNCTRHRWKRWLVVFRVRRRSLCGCDNNARRLRAKCLFAFLRRAKGEAVEEGSIAAIVRRPGRSCRIPRRVGRALGNCAGLAGRRRWKCDADRIKFTAVAVVCSLRFPRPGT